jgi:hypothetical protein
MSKLPITIRLAIVVWWIFLLVVFVDDLGRYRWFWPYDHQLLGIGVLLGILFHVFLGPRIKAEHENYLEKLDREEDQIR